MRKIVPLPLPPEALTRYFERRKGDVKPGAERMYRLLQQHPKCFDLKCILIAGTNGKGSVASMVESVLRVSGTKTGLYTSPHLVYPQERIRVDGKQITEFDLLEKLNYVESISRTLLPDASFFELTTAAALLYFQEQDVEISVIEMGVGGRLDSCNCMSPSVSVLTNVGLDHADMLGDSIAKIAEDKAYIARRNKILVVGNLDKEAFDGVHKTCDRIGAIILQSAKLDASRFDQEEQKILRNLPQAAFFENIKTTLAVLKCFQIEDPATILQGIKNARWPGRFDLRKIQNAEILFDVAHNPEGMRALIIALKNQNMHIDHVLFSCLHDKDWKPMLKLLCTHYSNISLTSFTSPRAVPIDEMQAHTSVPVKSYPALATALTELPPGRTLITGSLAFVGEAFRLLGIRPYAED